MYRAKADGKARHAVFDAAMHRDVLARLDLETDLRRAIEAESAAGRCSSRSCARDAARSPRFEALCRWEVEPREFVGDRRGDRADRAARALRACARPPAAPPSGASCVSVNVSARQLADPGFTAVGRGGAAASRAPRPADLRLEVTESAMTQDPERRAAHADRPARRASASPPHLDDFGTGASSLRFLHRFPGDALKIDHGLVIDMLSDPGSHEIVKAIVGLAHNLGMEVVGEGVETAEHLERLQVLGCELAQGFHLSAPLTAEAARARCLRPAGRAAEPAAPTEAVAASGRLVARRPSALAALARSRSYSRPSIRSVRSPRRAPVVARRSSTSSRSSSRSPRSSRRRRRPSTSRGRRSRVVVVRGRVATSAKRSRSSSSISSSSARPRSCIVGALVPDAGLGALALGRPLGDARLAARRARRGSRARRPRNDARSATAWRRDAARARPACDEQRRACAAA